MVMGIIIGCVIVVPIFIIREIKDKSHSKQLKSMGEVKSLPAPQDIIYTSFDDNINSAIDGNRKTIERFITERLFERATSYLVQQCQVLIGPDVELCICKTDIDNHVSKNDFGLFLSEYAKVLKTKGIVIKAHRPDMLNISGKSFKEYLDKIKAKQPTKTITQSEYR